MKNNCILNLLELTYYRSHFSSNIQRSLIFCFRILRLICHVINASLELMPASENLAATNELWPEVQVPPRNACLQRFQALPEGWRPPLTAAEMEAARRSQLRLRERASACVALFAWVCLRSTAPPRPRPLKDEWNTLGQQRLRAEQIRAV